MLKNEINKIIVHVSDSPDDKDFGLKEINEWHQKREFPKSSLGFYCGYHYVIRRSGLIEVARSEAEIGAHCRGHNQGSIGICWVGRDAITSEQQKTLVSLCASLCVKYALEAKQVFGHREFNSEKTCPNILDLDAFRDKIEIEIFNREVKNGLK